jgi:hypothetical protein
MDNSSSEVSYNLESDIFKSKVIPTKVDSDESISTLNIILCLMLCLLIMYFIKLSNDKLREYFKPDAKIDKDAKIN